MVTEKISSLISDGIKSFSQVITLVKLLLALPDVRLYPIDGKKYNAPIFDIGSSPRGNLPE